MNGCFWGEKCKLKDQGVVLSHIVAIIPYSREKHTYSGCFYHLTHRRSCVWFLNCCFGRQENIDKRLLVYIDTVLFVNGLFIPCLLYVEYGFGREKNKRARSVESRTLLLYRVPTVCLFYYDVQVMLQIADALRHSTKLTSLKRYATSIISKIRFDFQIRRK